MNQQKKSLSLLILMIPLEVYVLLFACDVFAFSLRVIGEYEKIDLSDSLLNPDNLLKRPTDRANTVTLLEGEYKLWLGELVANYRASFQYLKGPSSFSNSVFKGQFNEFFYQKEIENLTMSLGRKKVRWGVGYALSPTDIITQLRETDDPEDRLQIHKGAEMFQLSAMAEESQFDFIYFPEIGFDNWEQRLIQHRVGLRYYRYIEPVDVSVVGKIEEEGNWAAGLNGSLTLGSALELHGEYLFTSFNDTLYPDYADNPEQFYLSFPYYKKNNVLHDLLIGGQYTFKNYWNITLEYIYRSRGYSRTEWKAYVDHIRFLNQNLVQENHEPAILGLKNAALVFNPPLRQHYLFVRLFKQEIFQSFSLEWSNFMSLSDLSGFQILETKYTGSDWYDIYLRLQKFWGSSSSEFGLVPEDFKGIVGITLFFGS